MPSVVFPVQLNTTEPLSQQCGDVRLSWIMGSNKSACYHSYYQREGWDVNVEPDQQPEALILGLWELLNESGQEGSV